MSSEQWRCQGCGSLDPKWHLSTCAWDDDPTRDVREDTTTVELQRWWRKTTEADFQAYGPKAVEYGSQDLIDIGREWAQLAGWESISDAEAEYIGCLFYLRGKVARAMAAVGRHELPSHDTDHDLTVYSMMMRKARRTEGE